jgi:hypothetical protein
VRTAELTWAQPEVQLTEGVTWTREARPR